MLVLLGEVRSCQVASWCFDRSPSVPLLWWGWGSVSQLGILARCVLKQRYCVNFPTSTKYQQRCFLKHILVLWLCIPVINMQYCHRKHSRGILVGSVQPAMLGQTKTIFLFEWNLYAHWKNKVTRDHILKTKHWAS